MPPSSAPATAAAGAVVDIFAVVKVAVLGSGLVFRGLEDSKTREVVVEAQIASRDLLAGCAAAPGALH